MVKHLKQKKHFCTIGRYNEPTLIVKSGETIIVETQDTTGNLIRTEKDIGVIQSPLTKWNPLSGPIFIEDTKPGDTLVVHIDDIKPLYGQGWTGQAPGGVCCAGEDMIGEKIPFTVKICPIENGIVKIPLTTGGAISVQLNPFIGTIGTAPEVDSYSSLVPTSQGGNMDSADICSGNKLFLPISVEGSFLYLGDVHGIQGDGELNGAPVELAAECTLTLDVIKNKAIKWPRIETPEYIITVGNGRPLERACGIATTQMVYWLQEEYKLALEDVLPLINNLNRIRVNEVGCSISHSLSVMFPKKYLPNANK